MASRGRGHRGRSRSTGQAPPAFDQPSAFDQQSFIEAVGITVAAIAQACAIVNQGRLSDIQRLEAHRPPLSREGGVDDMRGIQDMGAGIKRKGDQPSSSSGKKQKASGSQGLQSLGYLGPRRVRVASQDGQMVCYHCVTPVPGECTVHDTVRVYKSTKCHTIVFGRLKYEMRNYGTRNYGIKTRVKFVIQNGYGN